MKSIKDIFKALFTSSSYTIVEIIRVTLITLAIVLPIRYFVVQPFYVKGASMEPNFYDYEYLVIDELSYRWHEPQHGEVIVLKDPRQTRQYFIKRVIGLPGDQVSFRDGQVLLNGTVLDESVYLDNSVITTSFAGQRDFTIPPNQYFVLGDNRSASFDSRRFGAIERSEIVGRVWLRAWPFDRLKVF